VAILVCFSAWTTSNCGLSASPSASFSLTSSTRPGVTMPKRPMFFASLPTNLILIFCFLLIVGKKPRPLLEDRGRELSAPQLRSEVVADCAACDRCARGLDGQEALAERRHHDVCAALDVAVNLDRQRPAPAGQEARQVDDLDRRFG